MFSLHDTSFVAKGITLHKLLEEAYGIQGSQISGEPEWVNSEKYDIDAKVNGSTSDPAGRLGFDQAKFQNQRMLRALLADRFKLTLHLETKEQSAFALVIAKSGLKLEESKADNPDPTKQRHVLRMGFGHLAGHGIPLEVLTGELSRLLGSRTVLDETGLTGKYDFTLRWTPDESQAQMLKGMGADFGGLESDTAPSSESSQPLLFDVLREQLGLELKSQQSPVQVLSIDHVEKPSEN